MHAPIIIGIAGGTGSGKTTVAQKIADALRQDVVLLPQDAYYKDQSHLSFDERVRTNYDHPLAFDTEFLIAHLRRLKAGLPVDRPVYDFKVHNRAPETVRVEPKEIIILEGILLFENQTLRDLCDIKVFVDTDADVRILRRVVRDLKDRGRDIESVVNQYLSTVKPMHEQFVEPSKRYADLIIPEGGFNEVAIDILTAKVRAILTERAIRPVDRV